MRNQRNPYSCHPPTDRHKIVACRADDRRDLRLPLHKTQGDTAERAAVLQFFD